MNIHTIYIHLYSNNISINQFSHCSELLLPVMVWLHGGGYSFGSGNTFLYGPDYLVAEDIVLVTLNYRLGPLGFLTAGPDAPGNQGLKVILMIKRDNCYVMLKFKFYTISRIKYLP